MASSRSLTKLDCLPSLGADTLSSKIKWHREHFRSPGLVKCSRHFVNYRGPVPTILNDLVVSGFHDRSTSIFFWKGRVPSRQEDLNWPNITRSLYPGCILNPACAWTWTAPGNAAFYVLWKHDNLLPDTFCFTLPLIRIETCLEVGYICFDAHSFTKTNRNNFQCRQIIR